MLRANLASRRKMRLRHTSQGQPRRRPVSSNRNTILPPPKLKRGEQCSSAPTRDQRRDDAEAVVGFFSLAAAFRAFGDHLFLQIVHLRGRAPGLGRGPHSMPVWASANLPRQRRVHPRQRPRLRVFRLRLRGRFASATASSARHGCPGQARRVRRVGHFRCAARVKLPPRWLTVCAVSSLTSALVASPGRTRATNSPPTSMIQPVIHPGRRSSGKTTLKTASSNFGGPVVNNVARG